MDFSILCLNKSITQSNSFDSGFFEEDLSSFSSNPSQLVKCHPPEEFDAILRQYHLPADPQTLIGRHMGVRTLDILTELDTRQMKNIVDYMLNEYLEPSDYANMCCVSRNWYRLVNSDSKRKRDRLRFSAYKAKYLKSAKENITGYYLLEQFARPVAKKIVFTEINANSSAGSGEAPFEYGLYDISRQFDSCVNLNNIKASRSFTDFLNKTTIKPINLSIHHNPFDDNENVENDNQMAENSNLNSTLLKSSSFTTDNSKICSKKSRKNLKRL